MGLFSPIKWLLYSWTHSSRLGPLEFCHKNEGFVFLKRTLWKCENQLELLESGSYFYCPDLLCAGQYIETLQLFGFSKAAIVVRAGRLFLSFGYLIFIFWKWVRMKVLLCEGGEWTMNVRQDIVLDNPLKLGDRQKQSQCIRRLTISPKLAWDKEFTSVEYHFTKPSSIDWFQLVNI